MLVDSGRIDLLEVITGQQTQDTYNMGLYVNNYALVEADTIAALTEAAWSGYARQTCSSWGTPTGPVSGVWDSVAANVIFTNSGGGTVTVYGFFFIGVGRGVFYGGALFLAPLTIPPSGNIIFSPSWNDVGI